MSYFSATCMASVWLCTIPTTKSISFECCDDCVGGLSRGAMHGKTIHSTILGKFASFARLFASLVNGHFDIQLGVLLRGIKQAGDITVHTNLHKPG